MQHPVLRSWHDAAVALLPPSVEVWDAHTHTGNTDPDGFTNSPDRLVEFLDEAGHAGAVFTTAADPAGYPHNNDRVLAEAAAIEGRLIPFLRVDPTADGALSETERSLELGHRGVKLHPRSEGFELSHPVVDEIASLAAQRRVPLLVHAGRGMDPLGSTPADLVDRHPGLMIILAHCAISDLATIAPLAASRPGLLFDTAWWNPVDHAALFSWVDAGQILYASDMPYGSALMLSTITTRAATQAGVAGPALSAVFGGNLRHVLDGVQPPSLGLGVAAHVDVGLLRVASNLFGAIDTVFSGAKWTQPMELARRATESASPVFGELLGAIGATIDTAIELDESDRRNRLSLLVVAASAALTPAAGYPTL